MKNCNIKGALFISLDIASFVGDGKIKMFFRHCEAIELFSVQGKSQLY
jgi:hypothetical protein